MARKRSSKSELKKQVRRAQKAARANVERLVRDLPPIMTSMPEPTKVQVQFNQPGLASIFLAELRRRARWKGKRGAPYRELLLSLRPPDGKKETIH